jgi:hypothetical protein
MPRRRSEDDDDWSEAANHVGEMMAGSINELRSADPPGRPFEPQRGPLGFCVDPAAYKRRPRRRKAST